MVLLEAFTDSFKNIEFGTTKKTFVTTDTRTSNISNQIDQSRVLNLSIISGSAGATGIRTKKETAATQTQIPTITTIPIQGGGGFPAAKGGGGFAENITDLLVAGGLIVGAILIVPAIIKKK